MSPGTPAVRASAVPLSMGVPRAGLETAALVSPYGHFSADGREYRITDSRTPRPWVNLIANPRMGLAISQTGSGFSWIDNSQLAVVNRWHQEFARDDSGKFVYLTDADSGEIWSLSPAPTFHVGGYFECRHGIGYSTFISEYSGIRAEWTLFVHADDTVELWRIQLHNRSPRRRTLDLTAFLEWCMGVAPSPRREFHKLFIETTWDAPRHAVLATNHMWDVPGGADGHWNRTFPYFAAIACTEPVRDAQGDMTSFLGRNGHIRKPAALLQRHWAGHFGRHEDPIAALRSTISLEPDARRDMGYVLAVDAQRADVERKIERYARVEQVDRCLDDVQHGWRERLSAHRIETPDPSMNSLINDWVRYQAIAGRVWGRAGYYQQSGAYGFRDQLQDSQVWLTIDPARCRAQANLHAAHQFTDGTVYHWWHPLTEQGHVTKMVDDLLWLSFVLANYIQETGRFDILDDAAPFLDDPKPAPLREHVRRAFERVYARMSPRGLPLMGEGDWNDGLSAVGRQFRGESVWMGHFLAGLLQNWAEVYRRIGATEAAADLTERRARLVQAINEHCWDGEWYFRATLDSGQKLGSRENRVGRIFLNAQTWAILNDVAPPERMRSCWGAVCKHLLNEVGALLLAPAYDAPVTEIGYITRYAPGLRENGGVYTHAATWAIAAACKMKDQAAVERLLTAINPANKDPERYWAEPYVLPGNVDGPDSPYHGRGGWTWYTGSAAWLHRVVTQWVLGVRPDWNGLRIEPCLPTNWDHARMTRPYRGCTYEIEITRDESLPAAQPAEVALDGRRLDRPLIPPPERAGSRHRVMVRVR